MLIIKWIKNLFKKEIKKENKITWEIHYLKFVKKYIVKNTKGYSKYDYCWLGSDYPSRIPKLTMKCFANQFNDVKSAEECIIFYENEMKVPSEYIVKTI